MEEKTWVDPAARVGLAARAVVYTLVAWVVVEVAFGRTRRSADERGALGAIAAHRPGQVLVVAVAVGLACLAVWQASIALRRDPGRERRLAAAGKAIVYAALTASAATVAFGHGGQNGERELSARLMHHAAGRVLIGAVGVAIAVGGVVLIVKGVCGRYDVDVRPPSPGRARRTLFHVIGTAGMVARGVVFGLVGGFFVDAAVTYDTEKARGLDGVLRSLARAPAGPWLLTFVAAGLAVFGVFSAMEVRFART